MLIMRSGSYLRETRRSAIALPDFYEKSGSAILHSVSISPDEKWMVVAQHHGSHMSSTYLLRRREGLKFAPMF